MTGNHSGDNIGNDKLSCGLALRWIRRDERTIDEDRAIRTALAGAIQPTLDKPARQEASEQTCRTEQRLKACCLEPQVLCPVI